MKAPFVSLRPFQKEIVERSKADWLACGFNEKQATSIAWAEYFEEFMGANWTRNLTVRIDTYCKDCKVGGQFLPTTVREFIKMHKGHNTKTIKLRS